MSQITYGSVCSGIEAASVAWEPLGWKPLWFSEIEPFPSAVLAHHWPHVPNLGDFTGIRHKLVDGTVEAPDVLVGGTPCFVAGTMVLSSKGYVPIECIVSGDRVVTHMGRLRKVIRTGSKEASVGKLEAVGLPEPLTVTGDHPFLSVDWMAQNTKRNGKYARVAHYSDPSWTPASEMPGKQWCACITYEDSDHLPRSAKYGPKETMYLAGMYLGDGHIRGWAGKNKKALVLSLNKEKLDRLTSVVGTVGYLTSQERTSTRATFCDTQMCDWLHEQFGELSHTKRLPAWVLGSPFRKDLLQGYLDTDGYILKDGVGASTTSQSLAYAIVDLLNSEGMVASVSLVKTPATCVIEGRTVNQRDWYQVRAIRKEFSRKSRTHHGYLLRGVQSFTPSVGSATVYNVEVDDDNSYIVQGAVVHNCQAYSVAGLRKSLDDARGQLTLQFVGLANAIDDARSLRGRNPCTIVWENVPGVLSTKDNAFGCFLGDLAGEDGPLEPPGGKWTNAGYVRGPRRTIAWRILDAQYFGVAQRRRRVFVVASAGAICPEKVLFEFDGMRRDSTPRRQQGQGTAADAPDGFGTGSHWDGVSPHPSLTQSHNTGGIGQSNQELFSQGGSGLVQGFQGDIARTLQARHDSSPCVDRGMDVVAIQGTTVGRADRSGPQGKGYDESGVQFTLTKTDIHAIAFEPGVASRLGGHCYSEVSGTLRKDAGDNQMAVAFSSKDNGADASMDLSPTMHSMGHNESHANGGGQLAVAFQATDYASGAFAPVDQSSPITTSADRTRAAPIQVSGVPTLSRCVTTGEGKRQDPELTTMIPSPMQVRRLTPTECARLQGFPDHHARIPWRGKPAEECPDGPQYKAYGNSMCTKVMFFIGKRLNSVILSQQQEPGEL